MAATLIPIKDLTTISMPHSLQLINALIMDKDIPIYNPDKIYQPGDSILIWDEATKTYIVYKCIETTTGIFNPDNWKQETSASGNAEVISKEELDNIKGDLLYVNKIAYVQDENKSYIYNGTAWVPVKFNSDTFMLCDLMTIIKSLKGIINYDLLETKLNSVYITQAANCTTVDGKKVISDTKSLIF